MHFDRKKAKGTFFFCENMLLFYYGIMDSLQPEASVNTNIS